jgi:sn-glycerol 3-phosphate transport system substrate-binding protein
MPSAPQAARQPAPHHAPLRRRTTRAVASVVATGGLLLAACGSPPTSGNGSGAGRGGSSTKKLPPCPIKALDKAKGKTVVKLWFGGLGGSPQIVMEDMAKRFNASQDKVVVKAQNQGDSYEETLRKYEGASSKPDQLPQIVYLEDTALGELVDKGQVLPAQSCMEADGYQLDQLNPVARSAFSADGVLYPGYFNTSNLVIYYNKVHFKKAGLDPNRPPRTFAELRSYAEKIKKAGIAPKPLSFKVDRWMMETWLAGIGEDVINNNNGRDKPSTKATFNTPEAAKMLAFFKKMKDDGLLNPFAKTEGSIDHYLALITEQSSMLVETSTASSTIRDALGGNLTAAQAGIDFDQSVMDKNKLVPGAGQLPGVKGPGKIIAGGGGFYILNTSSKAQQAASWEFLKFMLKPENSKIWHTDGGYLPIVKSVLDEPDVAKFWETDVAGQMLKNAVDQLQVADPDQSGPLIGPYQAYAKEMQGAMEGVILNGEEPKGALDAAAKNVDKLLKDYNGN